MAFWIMLIWVAAVYFLFRTSMSYTVQCPDGGTEYQSRSGYALLLFCVPLLIIATRTQFCDTGSYIGKFEHLPSDLESFDLAVSSDKSLLFVGFQVLFKVFVSEESSVFIAFVACLQAFCVLKTLKKYSVDLGFSVFMFVATGLVGSWMCNGIRQFIAVAILFACTEWLLNGKWYLSMLLSVFLMGLGPIASFLYIDSIPWYLDGIHQSVLIFLLAIPFIIGKPFNKRLWILAGILIVLIATGSLESTLSSSVETTNYNVDMEYVEADTGTNIFRVLVQAAPLVLAVFARNEIQKPDTPKIIQLAVNCSFVSTVLYVASAFTSGIFVGRLPVFFEMYNLILVPWLVSHPFKANKKLFTACIMAAYTAFFFYQVNISWKDALLLSYLPGLGG